jgi:hypothetical protein
MRKSIILVVATPSKVFLFKLVLPKSTIHKLVKVQRGRLLLFSAGAHDPNGNGRNFILAEQNSAGDMRIVRV